MGSLAGTTTSIACRFGTGVGKMMMLARSSNARGGVLLRGCPTARGLTTLLRRDAVTSAPSYATSAGSSSARGPLAVLSPSRFPSFTGPAAASDHRGGQRSASLHSTSAAKHEEANKQWARPGVSSEEEDEEGPSKKPIGIRHEAVKDLKRFEEATSALLEKLYVAIKPMDRFNDPFILTRGVEEDLGEFLMLDLGPRLGQYTVQVDVEDRVVLFQSPISGQVAYILSKKTGEWVGQEDGHSFEGLLVRDLTRQCNGYPKL